MPGPRNSMPRCGSRPIPRPLRTMPPRTTWPARRSGCGSIACSYPRTSCPNSAIRPRPAGGGPGSLDRVGLNCPTTGRPMGIPSPLAKTGLIVGQRHAPLQVAKPLPAAPLSRARPAGSIARRRHGALGAAAWPRGHPRGAHAEPARADSRRLCKRQTWLDRGRRRHDLDHTGRRRDLDDTDLRCSANDIPYRLSR